MKARFLLTTLLFVFVFYGFKTENKMTSLPLMKGVQQQNMGMMDIMRNSMTQMESVKMTGDPDYDFAMMMKLHQNGGIDVMDQEIKNGKNAATKKLAKKIRDGEAKNQKELDDFIINHTITPPDANFSKELKSLMQKAKDDMNSNMNLPGTPDKDFVTLMSMHHQHGIDLAHLEIKYGKDPQMIKLAQQMLDNMQKEKDQLDKLK